MKHIFTHIESADEGVMIDKASVPLGHRGGYGISTESISKISLLLVDMQKKDWPKVYFTQSQRIFFLAGNAVSIPVVKKTLHRGPLGVRSSEV